MSNRQAFAPGFGPGPQPQPQAPAPVPAPYSNYGTPYPYAQPLPPAYPLPEPGPPPIEQTINRECEHCKQYIQPGDESVELQEGIEARSQQTGFAITIPYPKNPKAPGLVVLHRGPCALEYTLNEVCPDESDEVLNEMCVDMANEMVEDHLQSWGITWSELEHLLRANGYEPEDERRARERAQEDD